MILNVKHVHMYVQVSNELDTEAPILPNLSNVPLAVTCAVFKGG
jgi:hypothetical protein